MSTFTFSLDGATSAATSFESKLSANTPDDKLTYSGTDPIVWDRVNNERLRRGLSPLPGTRPVDDGKTYPQGRGQTTPPGQTSKTFDIDAPPGMTREEAYAIFQKQVSSGGLTGFNPGDVLSAQTQAADGLAGAQATLTQQLSGFPGTDQGTLNSFKNIADTAKQSIAAGTTGIASAGSILQQTGAKIGSLFGTPVTNGITTSDFAKTATALAPMAGLSTTDVRATMASVGAATGQDFSQFTNSVGCGKYGFDATQLETAGLLKPGTVSTFLAGGTNALTDVLKSPAVWTGNGGINNLDSFLSNPAAQNLTQQNLMSNGLSVAGSLGLPINSLKPKDLGGVAANFAKSGAAGADWIKGQLPADKQAEFDQKWKDAQFAIGSADEKFNDAMTQQAPPGEAENTVNRQTLDAATTRILGNDKIPSFKYGTEERDPAIVADRKALRKEVATIAEQYDTLVNGISSTTPTEADAKIAQFRAIYTQFVAFIKGFEALKARALNGKPYSASLMVDLEKDIAGLQDAIIVINRLIQDLQNLKKRNQA